jgi:hypothetical protein
MDRNNRESELAEMTKLDEMLASEEEIVPSSGFLSAVMERVEDEARMPARIAFPWKRAMPGLAVVGGVIGWLVVELVRAAIGAMGQGLSTTVKIPAGLVQPMEQAGWVGLALAVSLASWLLARRLAGRAELM